MFDSKYIICPAVNVLCGFVYELIVGSHFIEENLNRYLYLPILNSTKYIMVGTA